MGIPCGKTELLEPKFWSCDLDPDFWPSIWEKFNLALNFGTKKKKAFLLHVNYLWQDLPDNMNEAQRSWRIATWMLKLKLTKKKSTNKVEFIPYQPKVICLAAFQIAEIYKWIVQLSVLSSNINLRIQTN